MRPWPGSGTSPTGRPSRSYTSHSVRILDVASENAPPHVGGFLESARALRHHRARRGLGMPRIDRDHAPARGVPGGLEIELVPARADEGVKRIPGGEQRLYFGVALSQIEQIDAIFFVTVELSDDEPGAVLGDAAGGNAGRMVGDLKDQTILVLRCTEPVKVDCGSGGVIATAVGERGITAVVDPRSVVRPGDAPELGEAHHV